MGQMRAISHNSASAAGYFNSQSNAPAQAAAGAAGSSSGLQLQTTAVDPKNSSMSSKFAITTKQGLMNIRQASQSHADGFYKNKLLPAA